MGRKDRLFFFFSVVGILGVEDVPNYREAGGWARDDKGSPMRGTQKGRSGGKYSGRKCKKSVSVLNTAGPVWAARSNDHVGHKIGQNVKSSGEDQVQSISKNGHHSFISQILGKREDTKIHE